MVGIDEIVDRRSPLRNDGALLWQPYGRTWALTEVDTIADELRCKRFGWLATC